MKLTKQTLKQIIKEELNKVLNEKEIVKPEDKPQEAMELARHIANNIGRPYADDEKGNPGKYWAFMLLSQFGGKNESGGHGSIKDFKDSYQDLKSRMVQEDRTEFDQNLGSFLYTIGIKG